MSDEELVDEEVDGCDHCGLPLAGQTWVVIYSMCDGCGQQHPMGVVHTLVCLRDFIAGEDPQKSMKRRAGLMRLN